MRHVNTFFMVTGAIGMLLTLLASSKNRRAGRRAYWGGALLTSISAFFIAYPPDWKSGIAFSGFSCFLMVFTAYHYTPYIKIRGKIYAFYVTDSQPDPSPDGTPPPGSDDPDHDPAPDSYGGMATAKKTWWQGVFAMGLCVFCVIVTDKDKPWWLAPTAAAFVIAAAVCLGYGDASWGYPIARGQRLQFVIIAIITLGVFPLLYLPGYAAGKRWPLRRKKSMEYQAHPRLQKKYPS
jgi:hypothetical protein